MLKKIMSLIMGGFLILIGGFSSLFLSRRWLADLKQKKHWKKHHLSLTENLIPKTRARI